MEYRIVFLLSVGFIVTADGKRVNECTTGQHDCHADAICLNTRRSFRCRCKPGFYGNGKICVDEDECDDENGGCVHRCENGNGNYTCSCLDGFDLDGIDGHNCVDKNECFENMGGCQHQCINTIGSYICKCNAGYSLNSDGRTCSVGTWCQEKLGCEHHCESGLQGTKCACRPSHVMDSNERACIPKCQSGNGGCQHICQDNPDGPKCSCAPKYMFRQDGKTCIPTCGINNGGCDRKCTDTLQGPRCSCPEGFNLHQDGKTCLDINECEIEKGGCSHECENTHGSFECICPKGYKVEVDGKTCKDIDECSMNTTCDHICVNTPGSFRCLCKEGYEAYGITHCGDIDECSINDGGCQHTCANMQGGYQCECRPGFRLHPNKKDCVAEKCLTLKPPVKATITCRKQKDEEACTISCHGNAYFTSPSDKAYTYVCARGTNYQWMHEELNTTLPSCSDTVRSPIYKKRAKFLFKAEKCRLKKRNREKFKNNFARTLIRDRKFRCSHLCQINYVNLECGTRRRRFREADTERKAIITAEFQLQVSPKVPSDTCDVQCVTKKTKRRLKNTLKTLRKSINKEKFFVRFEGHEYEVSRRSFKTERQVEESCDDGQILVKDKCVACSEGTYFDAKTSSCIPCPRGTYQDQEGQKSCMACPYPKAQGGISEGARNLSQCGGQCPPGHYSSDGFEECTPCAEGTFQSEYGRTQCIKCGKDLKTKTTASVSFTDCIVAEECQPGSFYDKDGAACQLCPMSTYQPLSGQDYCITCPGNTTTDVPGNVNSSACKDRRCGGHIGQYQGFIQSPNYPGDYPSDVVCTWTIVPEKGRRILVVIPEIYLSKQDKCGDQLIMRKSASPYSITTYETCESTNRPIAFTARSRKLWIQFKTDLANSAGGFSIPYVTFNEEYQDLIEDIVQDGRLYSSHQHREVLKDRKLLSVLLDVLATPMEFFIKYNETRSMFPKSFIRLVSTKVRRFFT